MSVVKGVWTNAQCSSLLRKGLVSFGFRLFCQCHLELIFGNCQHANQVCVMLGSRSDCGGGRGSPMGRKASEQKNFLLNQFRLHHLHGPSPNPLGQV